ncbi:copper amine oxidase N-terminal domain-containing protein [Clostridium sp. CS001]|uniref:stalk domain-containing protein n=1 Tax=Clostridium sp. CS001 TaxID=2880648 RepID=UPI001CF1B9F5|nr:stalk domain-containing protein [Clostridium sp. CS001]MCB2289759.1 copper amine oxidase N-terminal domain-containing protein [Clostridium sp. CS001]
MINKKNVLAIIMSLTFLTNSNAFATSNTKTNTAVKEDIQTIIPIMLNNKRLVVPKNVKMYLDRSFLTTLMVTPDFAPVLNCKVAKNNNTSYSITYNKNKLDFKIDDSSYKLNGKNFKGYVKPIIKNGQVYIPVTLFAQLLNLETMAVNSETVTAIYLNKK